MNKLFLLLFALLTTQITFPQSIDAFFSNKKMKKDLSIFKEIRDRTNSGLYKYRTTKEIDSIYKWAYSEIEKSKTYRDFYNIINTLTDFEGSLHNGTQLPKKIYKSLKDEKEGYFPYPLKLIEGKWLLNFKSQEIPIGSEILSINNNKMTEIVLNLYKYYTTDGINKSGKAIGINYRFSKYYRLHYGKQHIFAVTYRENNSNEIKQISLNSIGFSEYYTNFNNRYSKPFDEPNYKDWNINEMYSYRNINKTTGLLTINSFAIGDNEKSKEHIVYAKFLDSIFSEIKKSNISNLIVDARHNGGGTDPNDLITYSYLTPRKFSENKKAWISFQKIPFLRYVDTKVPIFLRPLGVIKYNKYFRKEFPENKNGKYYQNSSSSDHKIWKPNKNAFTGNVLLLVSPEVASAGSLFASMVAGNKNTVVIGEETSGGYYGHNGHTPLSYILPKSKIKTYFSIVNLEQDVPLKENQIINRGILPDHYVTQTYSDFLTHTDTQMNFVLAFLEKGSKKNME